MDKTGNGLFMMVIVIGIVVMNLLKPEKDSWDYAMIVLGLILVARQLFIFYKSKKS